jgi:hypothetical protein
MANDITGKVWALDSAGSPHTNPFFCESMWWEASAADDDLLVVDNGGQTLWKQRAVAGDANASFVYNWEGTPGILNGITITTIDGGTLYVQTR